MKVHNKTKVAVLMSGGVDSSVAAALLKNQGFDVFGIFIKTWTPEPGDGTTCTWVAERRDAIRVAARLDIRLITLDLEKDYRRKVINPLFESYSHGNTPNPDVWCNRVIKFGAAWKFAQSQGVDMIATGHYAQIRQEIINSKLESSIVRAKDKTKDQSYFLWQIPHTLLDKIIFPIGELKKTQIRKLAKKFDLPVAEKKDSQGICLLGQTSLRNFLATRLPIRRGEVVDGETGKVIGTHPGYQFFTIGQRHGFGNLKNDGNQSKERFVIGINSTKNIIQVGARHMLFIREIFADSFNWLSVDSERQFLSGESMSLLAEVRYHQPPIQATVTKYGQSGAKITFSKPAFAPAPGQSVVLFNDNLMVGGGVIQVDSL